MKISFVLLIKIHSHHNHNELDRLKNIQLKSFRKFLDLSLLKDFFIVASAGDIEVIRDDLERSYPEFPFVFVPEEELCPSILWGSGWNKQMILKLAAASLVETDYYLTLDTDVFLTRELTGSNLLEQGKLVYQRENPATHRKWWSSSARVLDFDPERVARQPFAMGVTPEYLVTDVCRRLQAEIQSLYGTKDWAGWLMNSRMSKKSLPNKVIRFLTGAAPWLGLFFSQARLDQIRSCDWTEYTLYWTYLHKLELVQRYYAETTRQVYGNCVWGDTETRDADMRDLVQRTFSDNELYHFSIVQSSIKSLDQTELASMIGPYLE
jgi:hypothetical protein